MYIIMFFPEYFRQHPVFYSHLTQMWCNLAADTSVCEFTNNMQNAQVEISKSGATWWILYLLIATGIVCTEPCSVCSQEGKFSRNISGLELPYQMGRQWSCLRAKSWRSLLSWCPAQSHLYQHGWKKRFLERNATNQQRLFRSKLDAVLITIRVMIS